MDYSVANPDVITKYKTAGDISSRVLAEVQKLVVAGASVLEVCKAGDALMEEELAKIYNSKKAAKVSKGIAFPTCVNPNHIPGHFSPAGDDDEANWTLKEGDVVNVMLGVQIDGFPAIVADTKVISEATVSGAKADLLHAAWTASEAAIRTFKPNARNWDVTSIVDRVVKGFGCTAVESMLTHNQERNVMYGPKEVILNPTKENKGQMDTHRFEVGEVYGLDVLVSTSADGKVKPSNYKTSLYKLTGNLYALKLKSSHQILGELKAKSNGPFPYNVRNLEDARKARMGLIECVNHQVVLAYDIMTEREGEYVAQVFTTFAVTANGIVKFTHPSFDAGHYDSAKAVDDDIKALISEPLKTSAKKKKSKKKDAAAA